MKIDLSGRVALVTGSTRGIGLEIARTLHSSGARVGIVGRDIERARAIAGEIGDGAIGFACDVSDPAQVGAMVADVEEAFGSLDILVNNAGLTRDNLIMRMNPEDWDTVMNTNLKGAFLFTKGFARSFLKQRSGRMINVASIVGLTGNAGQSNYAASKAALIGFTKSIARELAPRGITVNAIAPGFIETDMTAALKEEMRRELLRRIPLNCLGQPDDVANAALFLASVSARYITGQVLTVDGGMVM